MKRFSGFLILLAGCFWGVMGVFVRRFTQMGFSTTQIAALRLAVAAGLLLGLLALFRPTLLRVRWRELPFLFLLGIFSIGIMGVLYFTTIRLSTLSVAAVLLYLSPAAVMLMSALFFQEAITLKKCLVLLLAVLGCGLVSGLSAGVSVGVPALLTGIGSAITYGSYSILGPIALKKHNPFTITAYAFLGAALFLLIICRPDQMVTVLQQQPERWHTGLWILGLGSCTALIPFVLYTMGLTHTPPSTAAILACSEPVAATLFGILFYQEMPGVWGCLGMALVLLAILILNVTKTAKKDPPAE